MPLEGVPCALRDTQSCVVLRSVGSLSNVRANGNAFRDPERPMAQVVGEERRQVHTRGVPVRSLAFGDNRRPG